MVNRWFLVGYSLLTRWLLVKINHSQALVLNKASVLHRITLVGQLIHPNLWNGLI